MSNWQPQEEPRASEPLRRSLALQTRPTASAPPEKPVVPHSVEKGDRPWIPGETKKKRAGTPKRAWNTRRAWTRRILALAGAAVVVTLGWLYFRFYRPYSEVPAYLMNATLADGANGRGGNADANPGTSANPSDPASPDLSGRSTASGASDPGGPVIGSEGTVTGFPQFTLAPKPSALPLMTKPPAPTVFADDWNYVSEPVRVRIVEEYVGPSRCKLAYVTLKDPSLLRTAFAKDQFGRNVKELTSDMAKRKHALFAVNGDYYGYRGDGIIVRDGKLYRDVPVRDMLAFFDDGRMEIIDERDADVDALLKDGLRETWSFGPTLVNGGVATETFGPGIRNENPRTGVGMIAPGTYLFIAVDGRQEGSEGMKLVTFAKLFQDKGCKVAYNLDGGGSSTMVFRDRVVNSPCGGVAGFSGIGGERSLSDMLYIAYPGE